MNTPVLISFCIYLLLNFVQAQKTAIIDSVGQSYPIYLKEKTLVYNEPGGKIIDTLKNNSSVYLSGESKDKWLGCEYGDKYGWIKISNTPYLTLLSHNFIPGNREHNSLMRFEGLGTEGIFIVFQRGENGFYEQSLFTFSTTGFDSRVDRNGVIDYWIFYTGIAEHPYLFLFGGHSSDMNQEIPVIVMFGGELTKIWYPNPGNRVSSHFVKIKDNKLLIYEAYYCGLGITSELALDVNGIKRDSGHFNETPIEVEEIFGDTSLAYSIKLYNDNTKEFILLEKEMPVKELQLFEADYTKDLIKIKVNNLYEGWLKKEEFIKAFSFIYSLACCGCG